MLIETPGDDRLRSWEHKGATAKSCAKVANCTMEIVGRLRRRCSRHLAHDLSHLYLFVPFTDHLCSVATVAGEAVGSAGRQPGPLGNRASLRPRGNRGPVRRPGHSAGVGAVLRPAGRGVLP